LKKGIVFKINDISYIMDTENVEQIIEKQKLTDVPMTKDTYIEGIFSHRGKIITACNLKKYLKIKDRENEYEIFIILKNSKTAFLVDKVNDILTLKDDFDFEKEAYFIKDDKILQTINKKTVSFI
jgi:chemotaxis signal transduction protein